MLRKIILLLLPLLLIIPCYANDITDQAEQDLRHHYRTFQELAKTPASYYCQNSRWPSKSRGQYHKSFKPMANSHFRWDLRIIPSRQRQKIDYTFYLKPLVKNSRMTIVGHASCQSSHLSPIDIEIIAPGSKQNHTSYQI